MAVGRNAKRIMDQVETIYTVKSKGPPKYYLGNDYKTDKKGRLCVGSKKYIKEAVKRVESIFGHIKKYTHRSETGDNPELDET